MTLKIRIANHSDQLKWDNYVLKNSNSLAYHLFAWKEAVEKAYGFKGYYLIAEENNLIKGVLPLIHHKNPVSFGTLISLPYCDAAGPLADSELIEKNLLEFAFQLALKKNIKKIAIRSSIIIQGTEINEILNPYKVRMILNLPKSSENLWNSFKSKTRNRVKIPLREGLGVEMGGVNLLESFYPIFAENMRDLGSPVHSKRWIKSILHFYKNRSVLAVVRLADGTPVAGGIVLGNGNKMSIPWASSIRKYNRLKPNMMLYWAFLKLSCDMRYKIFDFGRSTINEGTYNFKKQWGATPSSLYWAEFDNCGKLLSPNGSVEQSAVDRTRERVASAIMKLPVTISTALGTAGRKYISL